MAMQKQQLPGAAPPRKQVRLARWYFGGLAGSMAACFTHPLDLLKVHLQTQSVGRVSLVESTMTIIRHQGVLAMYNGLSASILRQLTYSTTRFGMYEVIRQYLVKPGENMKFYQKIFVAGVAGATGGFVGTPADMVNVRMQNDIKLPVESRRNYKNALDGLWRVYRQEGALKLFSGGGTATARAVLMTIGQISFYEQIKQVLLTTGYFGDNLTTHFASSLMAAGIATTLTQPLDVMKTRMMNAKPGEYKSILHCALETKKLGIMAFFKGYVPAFVRLGPHTILTWVFLEQMRLNFGIVRFTH
ncbi:mitochondrial dicarboxylate carrier [Dermacentor andersoni]|uniref:mitochondrial dicarboxylate carrier n=1 Tax=Dermacentor andersoni TaxID=34620 RepID=UPI002155A957|nr:mitochondrial dicarboxylate carrier-like [Dermacentor andersoni]XP_050032954.1 mitochondrial dicarboxylate carrier-like [Dermacentor andersoni]XP_054925800.1 mitochondrial dicarboxylate carrier-like [Dermacentor andersoni]